jgi:hypothetical protein
LFYCYFLLSFRYNHRLLLTEILLGGLCGLSVADIFIIISAIYTFYLSLKRKFQFPPSGYLRICSVAILYLIIGCLYNIFVYSHLKSFLYDFKTVLYLTIPYLFLLVCEDTKLRSSLTYKRIFFLSTISGIIDFIIVYSSNSSEYPSFLGFPTFPILIPLPALIIGLFYVKRWRHISCLLILISVEITTSINRLALGYLFNSLTLLFYPQLVNLRRTRISRFLLILFFIILTNFIAAAQLTNPFNINILSAKSDGSLTRIIQLDNALINFSQNIPGIFGKGLGVTWFEYIPIPSEDIYSVGTSMGETAEDSMSSNVKFIFNWTPPVLVHKWGILGVVLLSWSFSNYIELSLRRNHSEKFQLSPLPQELSFLLTLSLFFIIDNFTFIGVLKSSMITSLLAFHVEDSIRKLR